MKNITIIAAAFCVLGTGAFAEISSGCYASTTSNAAVQIDQSGITCSFPGGGDRSESQAFVGVVLTFDKGEVHPKISAGLRRILVQGDDHVTGAEINFSTAPTDLAQTTVRVLGLTGKREAMANIGLGLDLSDQSILVNGGVQVPYLRAFVDYKPKDGAIIPQIEVNSYGKIAPVGVACDGDVMTPTEILQTLLSRNLLIYNGIPQLSTRGDIFDGQVYNFYSFNALTVGTANDSAFKDGSTCLNTTAGQYQILD